MLKRQSITFWATLFVTVVCLSLVAIDGWGSWNARVRLLAQAEQATSNLARAMSQQADDTIKAADTSLADLVERIEIDGTSAPALERVRRVMLSQVENLPQLNGLFAYDEQGRWIVYTRPAPGPSLNNADREYFRFHQNDASRGPHIGLPVVSRSTGRWIIPVSRRVNHRDGSFAGVVLATIDIDYFRHFYQGLDIGANGAVGLISQAGVIMVRRPFIDKSVGSSVAASALYRMYREQGPVGSAFIQSGQDGELRLNSYRRLERYPLFVTAAFSKDELLESWRRETLLHSSGVLLLALMLGLFGKRLVAQIALRLDAEKEVVEARDALESMNRTLEKLALQDGLTGLANRRQFDVTLGNELSRATRAGTQLAFVMIDVDYFKQYNDHYGHSAGDDALRAVSRAIRELTPKRPGDLAARYGGEEIGILLPNTDEEGARAVAERIRAEIAALGQAHTGSPYGYVTVSAGVAALIPVRGDLPAKLIEAADKALYAAKSAGRNRVRTTHDAAALHP